MDNIDDEFLKAFEKCYEIKKQRQKLYGDTWKNMPDWESLAQLKNKYHRLETLTFESDNKNGYESKIDTLVDLVNYALFYLTNEMQMRGQSGFIKKR